MREVGFSLGGAALTARASGALWWAAERTLVVADLHLGKAERLARRGGVLLPPYETEATLDRLAGEIAALGPARVVCLGDSFDDMAASALGEAQAARLAVAMAGRDWVWIAGNHDPGPVALGGRHLAALLLGPLVLRHAAEPSPQGEVSGHYHPKLRLTLRGRSVARPCFVYDAHRLILPAFGAYTGGLWADHPAIRDLFAPQACAVLTGTPCCAVPLAPARGPVGVRR